MVLKLQVHSAIYSPSLLFFMDYYVISQKTEGGQKTAKQTGRRIGNVLW